MINTQGPFCDMRAGEELIYRTYRALSQGPGWPNTLLIILYDEHGGCFDHVVPPNTAVHPMTVSITSLLRGFLHSSSLSACAGVVRLTLHRARYSLPCAERANRI